MRLALMKETTHGTYNDKVWLTRVCIENSKDMLEMDEREIKTMIEDELKRIGYKRESINKNHYQGIVIEYDFILEGIFAEIEIIGTRLSLAMKYGLK